jgi:hypothetical protein
MRRSPSQPALDEHYLPSRQYLGNRFHDHPMHSGHSPDRRTVGSSLRWISGSGNRSRGRSVDCHNDGLSAAGEWIRKQRALVESP